MLGCNIGGQCRGAMVGYSAGVHCRVQCSGAVKWCSAVYHAVQGFGLGCSARVKCDGVVKCCPAGVQWRRAVQRCGVGCSAWVQCGGEVQCWNEVQEGSAGVRYKGAVLQCRSSVQGFSAVQECTVAVQKMDSQTVELLSVAGSEVTAPE